MEVESVNINKLMSDQRIDRIDSLKMDCEGYEYEVLMLYDV